MSAGQVGDVRDLNEEARRWLVEMMDEEARPERVIAWNGWLTERPEHLVAYNEAANAWDLLGLASAAEPSDEELARDPYHGHSTVASWRRRKPTLKLVVGGVAVAAFTVAAFAIAHRNSQRRAEAGSPPQQKPRKRA